jgi:hypothetical protein
MSQRNRVTVEYTLKTDAGFLVERSENFSTIRAAMEFVRAHKHLMVGRPTVIS